ncbi:hypothetical protein ACIHEJ_09440 [Streptomyces sp. NPDC052301]|uniref:hypothetical protein n=1 Tax=Streptomyces sp. NPDC052301 TaxID=3365687 RepID=UPI0037D0BC33
MRHAPGPGALVLELAPDAALLRISVRDGSPHVPGLPARDVRRVGGHGLHLVDRTVTVGLPTRRRPASVPLRDARWAPGT